MLSSGYLCRAQLRQVSSYIALLWLPWCCRSGVFGPAAAANYRSNLLRTGNLSDRVLRRIDTPTLLLSSAKDRMLPSLAEGEQHQPPLCPCKQTVLIGLTQGGIAPVLRSTQASNLEI
jgi:hypothetical protein